MPGEVADVQVHLPGRSAQQDFSRAFGAIRTLDPADALVAVLHHVLLVSLLRISLLDLLLHLLAVVTVETIQRMVVDALLGAVAKEGELIAGEGCVEDGAADGFLLARQLR